MFAIESITNPVYGNAEGTHINCQIKFAELNEVHNFGANEWDTESHGQQIYADLKAGKYGPIQPYLQLKVAPQSEQPTTTGTQAA
jgi:hypothetical protein